MSDPLLKPFARWNNFDECKTEQMQIGHNEDDAQNICAGIQHRAENGTLFKAFPSLEILKSHDDELIVGGYASWEIIDAEDDYVTTEAMVNYLAKFFNLPPEYRNVSIDHSNFQIGTAILKYPEQDPQWFSHVHEKGMYLVTRIRNDQLRRTQLYRDLIRKGEYKMYSISGEAIRKELAAEGDKMFRKIYDIDPFETAIVKEGMNPKAGPLELLKQRAGEPKTDKERLIAHFGEEKALKLLELVGAVAYNLLPERGQKVAQLTKTVERRGSQWCVIHCHGPDAGKPIKCFDTKEEAEAMHRAIQANKTLAKDDRPPKAWMDNCRTRAQSFADDPDAFCGDLWHHGPPEKRDAFGKARTDLTVHQQAETIFRKHFPEYADKR